MVWAEMSADIARHGREADAGSHPFGTSAQALGRALKVITGFRPQSRYMNASIWLPTQEGSPIPSSSIVADMPASDSDIQIKPWGIIGRPLQVGDTIDMLRAIAGKRTLGAGIMVGPDLTYWTDVMYMASSVAVRQQFIPDVSVDGEQHRALWRPLLTKDDTKNIMVLAARMPAAGRALTAPDAAIPPDKSAPVILLQMVTAMVDYLVRAAAHKISPQSARHRYRFESTHDAWLYALRSLKKPMLDERSGDIVRLNEQVCEWQRPMASMARCPFRICFRLEEPEEDSEEWRITYMIQPHDDPSLTIPISDVWAGDSKAYDKGSMLALLGQASRICPSISAKVLESGLSEHVVDTNGAHTFMTQEAGALEQAGYGILLPAWWTGQGTQSRLVARANARAPQMHGKSMLTLESIIDFDYEIAMGDQSISISELKELAEMKTPLVRVRGTWVEAGANDIRSAIDFLKKGLKKATLRDVVRMALNTEDVAEGLDFGITAEDSIARMLERLDSKAEMDDLEQPGGFSGILRPYQTRGYSWLAFLRDWGLGGCLADDMGLGKTIQILALIQRDWQAGKRQSTLLVCPTSVINNWRKEAARFTPDVPVMVHHGGTRRRGEDFAKAAAEHAMVITSYGLVMRDVDILSKIPWGGIVLDEAQNIKNPQTKQSHAVRMMTSQYRFALTGTPVENNVGDLWSIMEFLNPGFLGNQAKFRRNFFVPIQMEQDQDAAKKLKRATGPFMLRRLKTDKSIISDLPEKMEMKVYCTLTKEQASLYASVLKETERELAVAAGIARRGIILATLSKLKQICNHPAHFLGDGSSMPERSGKLARLTEMLEELIVVGDRALIFTQFVNMGHMLKQHIQETLGAETLFLHGGVAKHARDIMVERFQDTDGPHILIVSLKAGGTGLNLTAANHVFHFDRWWNPAVENQATDRVFRIGQTRNVQVRKMICSGTLEEKIDEMIESKREVSESVVGTGEGWLTELSNEDLRKVLALSLEAVG